MAFPVDNLTESGDSSAPTSKPDPSVHSRVHDPASAAATLILSEVAARIADYYGPATSWQLGGGVVARSKHQPSEQVMNAVRDTLTELAPVIPPPLPPADYPARLKLTVGDCLADEPSVATPTPVYYLTLTDLAKGAGLEAAQLKSWRFLVGRKNQIVATAEVGVDDDGGATGPASFAEPDPVAVGSLLASHLEQSGEVRLLDVPPLHVRAVWIHKDDPDQDVVLPLLSESRLFGEPTPAVAFAEELRRQARQLLETPHEEEDSAP
jgi:hypothetical protein